MGKRRFASTASSSEHKTSAQRFANDLDVWIRGWDYGVEIRARVEEGVDVFEIWTAGGSTTGRSTMRMIGKVVGGEFVRMN